MQLIYTSPIYGRHVGEMTVYGSTEHLMPYINKYRLNQWRIIDDYGNVVFHHDQDLQGLDGYGAFVGRTWPNYWDSEGYRTRRMHQLVDEVNALNLKRSGDAGEYVVLVDLQDNQYDNGTYHLYRRTIQNGIEADLIESKIENIVAYFEWVLQGD